MKQSRRAQRMERQNLRARRMASFNLVSLMDIFTILVFFLLVNSTDMHDIPTSRLVQLPESISEYKPRPTVTVMITPEDVLLDGRAVGAVAMVAESPEPVVAPLRAAIEAAVAPVAEGEDRGEVTVMGDKTVPFSVLRKVMATFTDAGFGRVSLAVAQKGDS